MRKHIKGLIMTALVGAMVLGASAASAQTLDLAGSGSAGVGTGTDTGTASTHPTGGDGCLDLPAIEVCKHGDVASIDGPAMNIVARVDGHKHAKVAKAGHHHHAGTARRLPTTGVNVGDMLAIGLAALSSGGLVLRRLRMSVGL